MGAKSAIEWLTYLRPDGSEVQGHTFNPWWGCTHDGPECDRCYAEAWAKRTGHAVWGHDAPRRFFGNLHWKEPLLWNRAAEKDGWPRLVFCASMADVGETMSNETGTRMNAARLDLWQLIERTPMLRWLLLTKRPQNLPKLVPSNWMRDGFPSNVWAGTTAGDQPGWDKRVKYLARLPAKYRFVSYEPMLGPIHARGEWESCGDCDRCIGLGDLAPQPSQCTSGYHLTALHHDGIHWVIAGSESGPKARPADLDWVRSMRDECNEAGVAFFFKQWTVGREVISLPELDGHRWREHPERFECVREFPTAKGASA